MKLAERQHRTSGTKRHMALSDLVLLRPSCNQGLHWKPSPFRECSNFNIRYSNHILAIDVNAVLSFYVESSFVNSNDYSTITNHLIPGKLKVHS